MKNMVTTYLEKKNYSKYAHYNFIALKYKIFSKPKKLKNMHKRKFQIVGILTDSTE